MSARRTTRGRRATSSPEPGAEANLAPAPDYSGPAVLDVPGAEIPVTVALRGHCDPIDGRYHWYGRVAGAELPDPGRGEVLLVLPDGSRAVGRLPERDPWGNLRIVGIGTPPFRPAATG